MFPVAILLIALFSSFDRSSANGTTNAGGDNDDVISSTTGGSSDALPRNTSDGLRCHVTATDPFMSNKVRRLLKDQKVSLIEYQLRLTNSSGAPLGGNTRIAYRLDKWSRVTTSQGQTLLSLAFNYGVLSMATLTLGTHVLNVDLADDPPGCIGSATETNKTEAIKYLLMRDFDQNSPRPTLVEEQRVCHEVIFENDGYAVFRDQCYFTNPNTNEVEKDADADNVWLTVLYVLLFIVRYALIFFGPCLFISSVERMCNEQIPYVVKLKETLRKTVFFANGKPSPGAEEEPKHKRVVNLASQKGFPKLQELIKRNPSLVGEPVKVKFSQYDITVNYRRLQMENTVEVGLLQSLYAAIFQCNIRSVGPFLGCCREDMCYKCPCTNRKLPWIKFWRKAAKASMVVLVPVPYYIRLIVYYLCEHEEIMTRKAFVARAGLRERYETTSSLMHYLTPTHPFFICIYVVYFVTAIVLAVLPKKKREGRLLKIVVGSFRDLRTLSWTETLSMVTSNVIWPLKRFGLLGCVVGLVYWPIAIPVTLVVAGVYLIPTIYLTVRMAFYSRSAIFERMRRRKKNKPYQINTKTDKDMHRFEAAVLLDRPEGGGGGGGGGGVAGEEKATTIDQENDFALDDIDNVHRTPLETLKDNISLASSIVLYQTRSWRRTLTYASIAVLCIATLYGTVIVLSEVIGCLVEVVVFTIMGVIVNAADLLKYVMLVLMIFVYCCDCFNNVHKKYIKLNKALFGEIKGRIKDLSDVTSLPSALQENRGFKSQELNEQASYESPDDVATRPRNHWDINDLVLFVDSEDMPRVPKMLFDQVCQIRVAGVPGPVYRGLIEAMEQLLKIIVFIVFVFIVVLTFGAVYKVSTTNQMLATMVGGFLPMMLKTFMAPPSPDIEIGTVSFKSKLDEVIKNFVQSWPIYDLPFEVVTEADEATKRETTDANNPPSPLPPPSYAADVTGNPPLSSNPQMGFVITMETDGDDSNDVIIPLMNMPHTTTESNNNASATDNGCQATHLPTSAGEKATRFADPLTSEKGGSGQRTEVDILIYLPDKYEDTWLDEWSDITNR